MAVDVANVIANPLLEFSPFTFLQVQSEHFFDKLYNTIIDRKGGLKNFQIKVGQIAQDIH